MTGGQGARPRCIEPEAREANGGQGAQPRCIEPEAREA